MKSDRRHELAHNILDTSLARTVAFVKQYLNLALWALVILAVVAMVFVYARNRSRQHQAELQQQLDLVTIRGGQYTLEERLDILRPLADQNSNTYVAAMAGVQIGDLLFTQTVLQDPSKPPAELKSLAQQAQGQYQRVIDQFADLKVAVALARVGLGKLAVEQGDFGAAKAQFDAALQMEGLAGQPVRDEAKSLLEELPRLQQPVRMATTLPATTQPSLLNPPPSLGGGAPATPATGAAGATLEDLVPATAPVN